MNSQLLKLEGTETDDKQEEANDPKTDNHFCFGPPFVFKMVVEGGTSEDALAISQTKAEHLEDDRESFCDEDASDEGEEELTAEEDG